MINQARVVSGNLKAINSGICNTFYPIIHLCISNVFDIGIFMTIVSVSGRIISLCGAQWYTLFVGGNKIQ